MKKYKNRIIACIFVLALLIFSYWYGGDSPMYHSWNPNPSNDYNLSELSMNTSHNSPYEITSDVAVGESLQVTDIYSDENNITQDENNATTDDNNFASDENKTIPYENNSITDEQNVSVNTSVTDKNEQEKQIKTIEHPAPIQPESAVISDKEYTCTLTVKCDTILNNKSFFNSDKLDLLPEDGVIYNENTVKFYEGETVFNVLLREMKQRKIHMEFVDVPIYSSAYIEGIANIYEFDCGELSGWMYRVNGWFPNYGSSRYQLKDGDKIEWLYTCDNGMDIGDNYSKGNGR